MTIFKGDNSGAFGRTFITINLNNPYEFIITKAVFKCGCIIKEFENPNFPLKLNFDEEETKQLNFNNTCYFAVWDNYTEDGVPKPRKRTCKGKLNFVAQGQVV